jgi:hypothetical protein
MMSPAVVLAIIVATETADDQATDAMRMAAAEALGGEDLVVIDDAEQPSDPDALRVEKSVRARAAAHVVWIDPAHTRARVRLHVADNGRWTERTIAFERADTPVERGRALGFAVTAMLPEEALGARPHRVLPRAGDPANPGAAAPPGPYALRVAAIASTGRGGNSGGVGVSVSIERFVASVLSVRAGAGWRDGNLPSVSVDDQIVPVFLGIGVWPVRPGPERLVTVGVRLDGLVLYHALSRQTGDGLLAQQSRWVPGVDVLVELAWSVSRSVDIVTSVGAEVALGTTEVTLENDLHERIAATAIPPFRAVAEGGIRVSF